MRVENHHLGRFDKMLEATGGQLSCSDKTAIAVGREVLEGPVAAFCRFFGINSYFRSRGLAIIQEHQVRAGRVAAAQVMSEVDAATAEEFHRVWQRERGGDLSYVIQEKANNRARAIAGKLLLTAEEAPWICNTNHRLGQAALVLRNKLLDEGEAAKISPDARRLLVLVESLHVLGNQFHEESGLHNETFQALVLEALDGGERVEGADPEGIQGDGEKLNIAEKSQDLRSKIEKRINNLLVQDDPRALLAILSGGRDEATLEKIAESFEADDLSVVDRLKFGESPEALMEYALGRITGSVPTEAMVPQEDLAAKAARAEELSRIRIYLHENQGSWAARSDQLNYRERELLRAFLVRLQPDDDDKLALHLEVLKRARKLSESTPNAVPKLLLMAVMDSPDAKDKDIIAAAHGMAAGESDFEIATFLMLDSLKTGRGMIWRGRSRLAPVHRGMLLNHIARRVPAEIIRPFFNGERKASELRGWLEELEQMSADSAFNLEMLADVGVAALGSPNPAKGLREAVFERFLEDTIAYYLRHGDEVNRREVKALVLDYIEPGTDGFAKMSRTQLLYLQDFVRVLSAVYTAEVRQAKRTSIGEFDKPRIHSRILQRMGASYQGEFISPYIKNWDQEEIRPALARFLIEPYDMIREVSPEVMWDELVADPTVMIAAIGSQLKALGGRDCSPALREAAAQFAADCNGDPNIKARVQRLLPDTMPDAVMGAVQIAIVGKDRIMLHKYAERIKRSVEALRMGEEDRLGYDINLILDSVVGKFGEEEPAGFLGVRADVKRVKDKEGVLERFWRGLSRDWHKLAKIMENNAELFEIANHEPELFGAILDNREDLLNRIDPEDPRLAQYLDNGITVLDGLFRTATLEDLNLIARLHQECNPGQFTNKIHNMAEYFILRDSRTIRDGLGWAVTGLKAPRFLLDAVIKTRLGRWAARTLSKTAGIQVLGRAKDSAIDLIVSLLPELAEYHDIQQHGDLLAAIGRLYDPDQPWDEHAHQELRDAVAQSIWQIADDITREDREGRYHRFVNDALFAIVDLTPAHAGGLGQVTPPAQRDG